MEQEWETSWQRACKDTEHFRRSGWSFWVWEVVGAAMFGVVGGLVGHWLTPLSSNPFWLFAYPTIGGGIGVVLGFAIVFGLILGWNLFRAPYRQRNEARARVVELEDELKKPKLFDVECRTTTIGLPLNLQKDGTWKASAVGISPSPINIIHRGDLITITRVTMSPQVLFNYMDGGWETTNAITVTPQRPLPAILGPYGAGDFEWDVSNPLQWVLMGLPLTMSKDQRLPLPAMKISVQDANLVGEHFTKLDWCRVVIRLTIRTDKGSPYIPDLFIELTSSDIPNPNPRYYWKDVTNESKD